MCMIVRLVLNRNTILISSLVIAFFYGQYAIYTKDYIIYLLGMVMSFSMSGIKLQNNSEIKLIFKSFSLGILLNYFLYGIVVMCLSYFLIDNHDIFVGFVVIAATPPGVAILPFTYILEGDLKFSLWGVSGAFLSSIILTPLIILIFSGFTEINVMDIIFMVFSLLVIPFFVSRLLIVNKKLEKNIIKIRGKVVNIGFAVIIYTAIGINKDVFWGDLELLVICSIVLFISTFGIGLLLEKIFKILGYKKDLITSLNLLSTIKSSGFAVVTSMSVFGKESAIPSAILSVFVLLYLLFLSIRKSLYLRKQ